jgi:hypothetical protein
MFRRGNYLSKCIYLHGEKQWLVMNTKKGRCYHTHVDYSNRKAAQMICIRADEGIIPEDYPSWMVDSINRVWFGKDYTDRTDICNDNLYTNNLDVRFPKKKKKHGNKGYVNIRR